MKIFCLVILILFACAVGYLNLPKFGSLPDAISMEKINKSPNYHDGKFHNSVETPTMTSNKNFFSTMWDLWFGSHHNKRPGKIMPANKIDLRRLKPDKDVLVWFGHSSYFIQLKGLRYLIDPVFSDNASPIPYNVIPFQGTNIYNVENLPDIDYLFITHDHYDHLDYETIKKLRPKVKQVIAPLGVGSHLRAWGYNKEKVHELDWNQTFVLADLDIVCLPARHFSGRSLWRNKSLWASFLIKTWGYTIYIGGDSGYGEHYAAIGEKYPDIDLALLENGQYDDNWRYIHEHPHEFVQAAKDLKAKKVIPVHNSKFTISNHAWYEPLDKVYELSKDQPFTLLTPRIGEIVNLKNDEQTFMRWWDAIK